MRLFNVADTLLSWPDLHRHHVKLFSWKRAGGAVRLVVVAPNSQDYNARYLTRQGHFYAVFTGARFPRWYIVGGWWPRRFARGGEPFGWVARARRYSSRRARFVSLAFTPRAYILQSASGIRP